MQGERTINDDALHLIISPKPYYFSMIKSTMVIETGYVKVEQDISQGEQVQAAQVICLRFRSEFWGRAQMSRLKYSMLNSNI